ncbi:MAG: VanZ family protein [Candidatus Micrarchaeia archaeon]
MFDVLVRFRKHLLWAYSIALALVLALPLAPPTPDPIFSYMAHFLLFFGLHTAAEFAHLFAGGRHIAKYTLMMAVLLEAMQAFIPYRQFDIIDLSANIFGVFCGYALALSIRMYSPLARTLGRFSRKK